MIKAGITGGIGSGKTTVCEVFELLGVPVYYADLEAKNMLDNDPAVFQAIIKLFGNNVLQSLGKIDRKKLAAAIFNDKNKLEALNRIVHPAVALHYEQWCLNNNSAPYTVKEAAILFESGSYRNVDKIITVTAPAGLKIERVMKRDKVSSGEVEKRMAAQLTDEEKMKRSDFVIINNEAQLLIPQVLKIHNELSGIKI